MSDAAGSARWMVIGAVLLFVALIAAVVALRLIKAIEYEVALLMFVALIGLYVGFGILIAVYRFMRRLE